MKKLFTVFLLFWGVGAVGFWYWNDNRHPQASYETVALERGDLLATINATGTLEPEEVVDVGAQVAGQILSFGKDPRDPKKTIGFGTPVEQGTILAQFDDALYRARADQVRANVARAEADVELTQIKLRQAERDYQRVLKLRDRNSISSQEYDAALAEFDSAKANLAVVKSAIAVAMANLEEANINLGYTTIRSPVRGVIVDRRVNIGQTVLANLNAPSLFLIAKDLSRMEIWASVNETDVGAIHPGQAVRFTVSAYPRETFKGKVSQIRLNASMTQSVVTYTVVVEVDNKDGKLLPYLTARVHFEVEQRKNVLLVSNAALRWLPKVAQVEPESREVFAQSQRSKEKTEDRTHATLWVKKGEFVRPIPVRIGMTDGLKSEVISDEVSDGADVIVGQNQQESSSDDGKPDSPFLPQIKNGKAKR